MLVSGMGCWAIVFQFRKDLNPWGEGVLTFMFCFEGEGIPCFDKLPFLFFSVFFL